MSNIFVRRVAKMLDGLPMNGYSESAKPIRAPANARKVPRKGVPSEFELHSQVLHNTWGRIEFEIEPLNQSPSPLVDENSDERKKSDTDYKVRVKTRYRMKPPQIDPAANAEPEKEVYDSPEAERDAYLKKNPDLLPNAGPRRTPPPPQKPFNAISSEQMRIIAQAQAQEKTLAKADQSAASNKHSVQAEETQECLIQNNGHVAQANVREDKANPADIQDAQVRQSNIADEKIQSAKRTLRKEFACRESRRMMTLITERKAQAAILQEKSVFANFALPVLETLAKSPQTPKSSLKWLAFHESIAIRKAVAKNKNTDLEILAILARDENESIRMTVAENPLIDKEFLLKLLHDDTGTVVQKAQEILQEMTQTQSHQINIAIAPATTEVFDHTTQNQAASTSQKYKEPGLQYAPNEADYLQLIAAQDTTPSQRLSQLSRHNDWNVRLAVANNPHTTVRTLSVLARDPVPLVRKRVMFNPNCPPDISPTGQRKQNN